MTTAFCTACGAELAVDDRFCARCGKPTPVAAEPAEIAAESVAAERESAPDPVPAEPEGAASQQTAAVLESVVPPPVPLPGAKVASAPAPPQPTYRTNVEIDGRPLELWAVVGLFAAAGIYLVQLSVRALPDSFRLFNVDFFPNSLAFVLLILVVMVGALGAALVALGWMLQRGDRVGRGLAYLAVASLVGLVIFGTGVTTGETLSMFAGLAAAAVLAFAPAVQEVFIGPNARQHAQPTSIVVARVALVIWLILLSVAAVLDFCLADIQGRYVAYGVFLVLVAFGGFVLFQRLEFADPRARLLVTIGAAVALLFLLLGSHDTGFAFLFGLTISIPICLWLPADARAFYGDKPLVIVRGEA